MHRKIKRTSMVTGHAAAVVVAGVPFGTGVAHAASVYPSSAPIVSVSAHAGRQRLLGSRR
jgi:hypothetical protein